jgi:AcrR family transcriptional regulator
MVAAKARVSLAGIYYHVQSKDELLFLIQYGAFQSILKSLKEKLAAIPDAAPVEKLHVLVSNHLGYFLDHIDELRVCSRELDILTGAFYKKVAEVRREYFKLALDIVKEISANGEGSGADQRTVDPRTATLCLFGMLNWVYTWYDSAKDTPDSLSEKLLRLYLGGVLSEVAGEVEE